MSLGKRIISGYLWTFFGQWIVRLSGLASTLILVRILSPSDFGLIALATLVVGFFDVLTNTGVNRYILLQDELDNNLLDSAWTVNFLFRILTACLIYFSSGYFAEYFNDNRLIEALQFICITQSLSAAKNIGMNIDIKEGKFKSVTLLNIISKIFAVSTGIYFAFTIQNYWALIYSTFVFEIVNLIGSYYLSSYRPRFNFRIKPQLFLFTYKLMFRSILGFTRSKLDTLLIGSAYGTVGTGKFSIALEFAQLPLLEIIAPSTMPIFSGLVQYKNDKILLFDKTFKYLSLVYLLIIPSIIGIFVIADQISDLVLGEKWGNTSNIMKMLAILMLPFSLQSILDNLYDTFGKTGTNAIVDFLSSILILAAFYYGSLENLDQFVLARVIVGSITFLFMILVAKIVIGFPIKKMITVLFVPSSATLVMFLSFNYIYLNTDHSVIGLVLNVSFGAMAYTLAVLLLLILLKKKSNLWQFNYSLVVSVLLKIKTKFRQI